MSDCSKQPRLVDCCISDVNKLDRRRRRRRVLLTTRWTCRGEIEKCGVWDKVPEESTLILEIPKFPYSTVWDRGKEASMPKASSISPVALTQYRLVTDGRTDKRTHDNSIYRAGVASPGSKNNGVRKTE